MLSLSKFLSSRGQSEVFRVGPAADGAIAKSCDFCCSAIADDSTAIFFFIFFFFFFFVDFLFIFFFLGVGVSMATTRATTNGHNYN